MGLIVATTISGCSQAASRTLTIRQLQSTETYPGAFRIETSELPTEAIESITEAGGPGDSATVLDLNMDYEIEVILKLAAAK